MILVLLILLILMLGGLPLAGPVIPQHYGMYPSGILTVIIVVLVVLLLTGRM